LEADWNEAATIAAEETREQLLDIVGPAGTPDDGYAVTPVVDGNGNATGDLTIGPGTMYVGGERVQLDAPLDYGLQNLGDWVDNDGDPLWVPSTVPDGAADESVYLLLREQEVGAVEDGALLDIALGGPDTAQRTRIAQRVVRRTTGEATCGGAWATLDKIWAEQGLTFDPGTMQLRSGSTLQVSFQQDPQAPTPCDPVAQGGYLGAENQLIRVQVAEVDEDGAPMLVWGFDNASFLYRVDAGATDSTAGTTVLHLPKPPVDEYHQPALGQTVEVLRAAVKLSESSAESGYYAAATSGIVTTVTTAYQPDTQDVVIGTALASPTTDSPVVFLRVWQETIAGYTGGPAALGDTGIQVTVEPSGGVYHTGDYWIFAVRPGAPTLVSPVYPQRYLDGPQPPEGPRLWVCPLAVVSWSGGTPAVVDCRHHFCNLVTVGCDGGGDCCIDVRPDTIGGDGLQALINRYANGGPITLCLAPGTYRLGKPLVITAAHTGLTIDACRPGVVIAAEDPTSPAFALGLIILDHPAGFTLRGIELQLPLVPFGVTAAQRKAAAASLLANRQRLVTAYLTQLRLSMGVHITGGGDITIDGCVFSHPQAETSVFGAGVFAIGDVQSLELVDNRFEAAAPDTTVFASIAQGAEADNPPQLQFGLVQVPARSLQPNLASIAGLAAESAAPTATTTRAARAAARAGAGAANAAAGIAMPSLADATVARNHFEGVTVPMLAVGGLGLVRISDNTVRASYGGFWLLKEAPGSVALAMLDRLSSVGDSAAQLGTSGLLSLGDPAIMLAIVLGRVLPLSPDATDPAGQVGAIATPVKSQLKDAQTLLGSLYASPPAAAPTPATTAPVSTTTGATAAAELPTPLASLFRATSSARASAPVQAIVEPPEPRLELTGNDVDAFGDDPEAASGPALIVAMLDDSASNSVVCGDNRLYGRVTGSTVNLLNVAACTVTGNLVANSLTDKTDLSFVLTPNATAQGVPAVAVTGNVFFGRAQLPARPLPAPFDTWGVMNTEVPG
jgi:hypothetical protein